MLLSKELEKIKFFEGLTAAAKILEKAEASTSFWGGRLFKVQGYEGTYSVHSLAIKMLDFLDEIRLSLRGSFLGCCSLEDRVAGVQICQKIAALYQETDKLLISSNIITRVFLYIREVIESLYEFYNAPRCLRARDHFSDYPPNDAAENFIEYYVEEEQIVQVPATAKQTKTAAEIDNSVEAIILWDDEPPIQTRLEKVRKSMRIPGY